ncbi:hypothetical protein OS493_040296, partial [Desmophyllum pertusum]
MSPHYFKPIHFDGPDPSYEIKPGDEEKAKQFLPTPDVDGNDQYQVLSWDMEFHGAHGNNLPTPRRAFSTRWLGDDAVKEDRPWMNLPPSHAMENLKLGNKLVDSG